MFIFKKKEQVLWCCNDIVKVNAANNEDAQWNIVEETNQKKKAKKGHNDVTKKKSML